MKRLDEEKNNEREDNKNIIYNLSFGLLIATLFIIAFNAYQLNNIKGSSDSSIIGSGSSITGMATAAIATSGPDILPKGIPKIYGNELGVSFDDVSVNNPQKADATIRKIGALDEKIELIGTDLQRYISIASKISCEYCCGAPSIIFADGKAACGCAHSYTMRGLAKFLIKYHPNDFTDDQILEEMGKWKTLFFPEKIIGKARILQSKGIELNYINLASNKYRDIEKGTAAGNPSGGMVGGC